MTFYKIKHISVKRDGTIIFNIGRSGDVFRHSNGNFYIANTGDEVTPMYDSITGDLVGFSEPIITIEEYNE